MQRTLTIKRVASVTILTLCVYAQRTSHHVRIEIHRSERKARRCGKKKRKRDKQERNNNMTITNMYVEEKEDRIPLYELTVGGRRSLKDYEITDFYAVCLNNTL